MSTKSFTIKQILSDHWNSFLSLGYGLRPAIPIRCNCGNIMELVDIFIPNKSSFLDYIPPPAYNNSC